MDQAAGPADSTAGLFDLEVADHEFTIEVLSEPTDISLVGEVFKQIWGARHPIVANELLRAISHAHGYVAGVFDTTNQERHLVGASVGFRGVHDGAPSLHSHITGLLAGARSAGLGRALKQHQRQWCADQGIDWITWTFDPLVRRNAWFNIEVLHAHMTEYLFDFYGPMEDAVNLGDLSDRLLAAWSVPEDGPLPSAPDDWTEVLVPTPENIVEVRRMDSGEAERWRTRLRIELGDRMAAGAVVTGFDRGGHYIVRVPS